MLASDDPARAELSAVDLAEGLDALGALTGEVTTDDVLDQIFGAFCIGK
jgi:tRNA modification GTPase